MKISRAFWWCLAMSILLALVAVPGASALSISQFKVTSDEGGRFGRQAGGHPDLVTEISFPTENNGEAVTGGEALKTQGNAKDFRVDLPPGFIGDPTVLPTCPIADIAVANSAGAQEPHCPATTAIGSAHVEGATPSTEPIYNMTPRPDSPALFAFNATSVPVFLEPVVRPGDYGISTLSVRTTQAINLYGIRIEFWGNPVDPIHDSLREVNGIPVSNPLPPAAFLRAPTSCPRTPDVFFASVNSWQQPEVEATALVNADPDGTPFVFTGCESLPFEPSVQLAPESKVADSPTGLGVDIKLPQSSAPDGLSTADVKRTTIKFPTGFSISPSAAGGLGSCSEAQIGLGSNVAPSCPEASAIGTVQIKTPLLDEELTGRVYIAQQHANPFGSNYAIYLTAKGPGFYIKLPGQIDADAQTGQVTATIGNQPQLPYEAVAVQLFGGPRAAIVNPTSCGKYLATVEMESWASSNPVSSSVPLEVNGGCNTGGFKPGFKAGTAKPQAGAFSPFNLQVTQADGESNLSRLKATLPPGLLAKLAGVPLCGDAQAASGDCPSGSQVGTTTIGAGPGSSPIYVPEAGKAPTAVYLGGPYKGAPYSLIVKVPAQAGPFDLGTVVVRNALQIDPFTTQVTAESDPLPQILEGIPISYRDVRVEINKPEFTVNPTNCSQFQVASVLTSASGQTSSPSAPFAAANCEGLEFKPSLKVQLKGATKRTGRPALKAVLTYPSKGSFANIARAQVNLPKSLFLEQGALNKTCTKPVLLAGNCPASTIYGKAKAWSPLLERPLEGNVYLVGGFGYKLPALVADLNGQIHVLLASKVDSGPNKGLRTTFEAVPDAPVSRFVLEMKGGKKYGLLVNSESLCKGSQQLKAAFTGQNGAVDNFEGKVVAGCGGKKSKKSKSKPNHKKKV
jgi:hypothetical protein